MKKVLILVICTALVISSCDKLGHQVTKRGWKTEMYGKDVYNGDSIFVEASLSFLSFKQDNFFKSEGTVNLYSVGEVYYIVNDDMFGLVSRDGKKMPAVIRSGGKFKAMGTWTAETDDKVKITWNSDSTMFDGAQGECVNLNPADSIIFMQEHGQTIEDRTSKCQAHALNIVNEWLKTRSELTYDPTENEWNATIDGQKKPVMWELKVREN